MGIRGDGDADAGRSDPGATIVTVPSPLACRGARPASTKAMREHEMAAMRGFVRLVVVLVVSVAAAVPFFDAGGAESAMLTGLGVALAGALRTGWVLRQDRLDSIDVALFGAACTVGGAAEIYFFGVFSPRRRWPPSWPSSSSACSAARGSPPSSTGRRRSSTAPACRS